MTLNQLIDVVTDKSKFQNLTDYIDFCQRYLDYIGSNHQAKIISRNENNYFFYQYTAEGNYQITRPLNSNLLYDAASFASVSGEFIDLLKNAKSVAPEQASERKILNDCVYTIQQSVGASLDALPQGLSNRARKLNGEMFEKFIREVLCTTGIDATCGTVKVPIVVAGTQLATMNYQHDLLVKDKFNEVQVIGSIKTSSKDRAAKIFMDKFLYSKLTDTALPHIAIFLNDVQRMGKEGKYGISSTFLPGHFKGFTLKLNPLDGVYFCDMRPNMKTEAILKDHIKTLDCLLCEDIWTFV